MHVCDFCGKNQNQVKRIIVSQNNINICDECIFLCMKILIQEQAEYKDIKLPEIKENN